MKDIESTNWESEFEKEFDENFSKIWFWSIVTSEQDRRVEAANELKSFIRTVEQQAYRRGMVKGGEKVVEAFEKATEISILDDDGKAFVTKKIVIAAAQACLDEMKKWI